MTVREEIYQEGVKLAKENEKWLRSLKSPNRKNDAERLAELELEIKLKNQARIAQR